MDKKLDNEKTLTQELDEITSALHEINLRRIKDKSISFALSCKLDKATSQLHAIAIDAIYDEWTNEVERICGKKTKRG